MATLNDFYRDVQAAVTGDLHQVVWFRSHAGLCHNLVVWCRHNNTGDSFIELKEEMLAQFYVAGLHYGYPFNNGDSSLYDGETNKWVNPKRLAWVADHI